MSSKNIIQDIKKDNVDRSMNIVDREYWENAIKKYLSLEDTIIAQENDCTLDDDVQVFNTMYKFYIIGLNKNTSNLNEIKKEVQQYFPSCYLCECDEPRPSDSSTFYIRVSNNAQRDLQRRNDFNECCGKLLSHRSLWIFFLFLILFLISCKLFFEYLNTYSNSI